MLSLSPRHDLFRFCLPKDFINDEIDEQIRLMLDRANGPIKEPIDYLNESIVSVNIPGISDLTTTMSNTWFSAAPYFYDSANPLSKISNEFKVTFRMNNGMFNFYMMFESILAQHHVNRDKFNYELLQLKLLNSIGEVSMDIKFFNCVIKSVDKIPFSYNKIEHQVETFEVTFNFNNIDIDIII